MVERDPVRHRIEGKDTPPTDTSESDMGKWVNPSKMTDIEKEKILKVLQSGYLGEVRIA